MDAEFSLLNNAAKVTVSLTEFESIVKHLLGSSEREEVRIAVKELIAEVRKSGDTFVDVLKPLYALANAREFKKEFPTIRAHFKSYFLKEGDNLRRTSFCPESGQQFESCKRTLYISLFDKTSISFRNRESFPLESNTALCPKCY